MKRGGPDGGRDELNDDRYSEQMFVPRIRQLRLARSHRNTTDKSPQSSLLVGGNESGRLGFGSCMFLTITRMRTEKS
eukprot:579754-Amphidinium_carterae.1